MTIETNPPLAGCRWVVEALQDRGPGHHYRYHIQGRITDDGREPQRFSWSVPDLADPRFDLSGVA